MKKIPLLFIIVITACNMETGKGPAMEGPAIPAIQPEEKSDMLYHYSIWYAFVNLVFDGNLTAKDLRSKGDIALGSYNGLNGELVMVDGKLYQILEDGTVQEPSDEEKICYTNATFFNKDQSYMINETTNYDGLRESINQYLPSLNRFYAFRIHGTFDYMKCGGVPPQGKPYETGLDELLPGRPVFEKSDVEGTMVGFFCPDYIGQINVAGYHLHFVSDDASFGGHVMDFNTDNLEVGIDHIDEYKFVLIDSEEFLEGDFEKEFQYGKK